jgi:hypothetical protein
MAFRHTADEYRQIAKRLRLLVGQPKAASRERLEQMAQNHEMMAEIVENFIPRRSISGLCKSPSIIPDWPEAAQPAPVPPVRPQSKRKSPPFQLRLPGL